MSLQPIEWLCTCIGGKVETLKEDLGVLWSKASRRQKQAAKQSRG